MFGRNVRGTRASFSSGYSSGGSRPGSRDPSQERAAYIDRHHNSLVAAMHNMPRTVSPRQNTHQQSQSRAQSNESARFHHSTRCVDPNLARILQYRVVLRV